MPEILAHLRYNVNDVKAIVSASRTATPHTAKDVLKLLHIKIPDGDKHKLVPSSDLFDHKAWDKVRKSSISKKFKKLLVLITTICCSLMTSTEISMSKKN